MWAYKHTVRALVWGLLLVLAAPAHVYAERIKDLVSIGGVRDNPLIGYGLVVGSMAPVIRRRRHRLPRRVLKAH